MNTPSLRFRWLLAGAVFAGGCASSPFTEPLSGVFSQRSGKRGTIELLATGSDYEQRGEWDRAHRHYAMMTEKHPKDVRAYYRAAACCDQLRRHPEAQAWYAQAIELTPDDGQLHNDLGYSYYLSGDLDQAEASLREALQLDEQDARSRNNLGLVLGSQGRVEEALEQFRAAGSEADAQFNLAFVYSLQGRFPDARACFQKALSFDPNHAKSKQALASFDRADKNPQGWREDLYAADGVRWVPYVEGMEQKAADEAAAVADTMAAKMSSFGGGFGGRGASRQVAEAGGASNGGQPVR